MKFVKIFSLVSVLSFMAYISFNITYDKVSAIVIQEAKEEEKNKIKIHPIIIDDENHKEDKIEKDNDYEKLNVITNNFIFIGDDRLNMLMDSCNESGLDSVEFILSKDADYRWMNTEAISKLDRILNTKGGHYNIVINPGIEDLDRVDDYIKLFNNLGYKYPDQNIFILGIAPLDELEYIKNNIDIIDSKESDNESEFRENIIDSDQSGNEFEFTEINDESDNEFEFTEINIDILNDMNIVNNDDIYAFNVDIMRNASDDIHIIHIFQELMENGYSTIDGYYLDENTSNLLLKTICNHIQSLSAKED